jgi:DNA-binding LacI/PurR family transcriptional regulator/AraC-like DNA-binding protein
MREAQQTASAGKKRIGLILASIHTGSALNVWSSFAREAAGEGMTLFIFPGGRLNAPDDMEHLRNPVFSLVNSHNLDALISWSSTIGYTVSPGEFEAFHRSFGALPYLTIAHKVPDHPCVQFDAYNGIKNLAGYFIRNCGAKKIAFLHGPDSHASALDRFNGYRAAIREAGFPYESRLVTDPAGWDEGRTACAQLFEERGLRPGKDFDTLIGSSDMMVLPAIQYLAGRGYTQPGDYRAGGFNNSIESKILSNPFSTVRMPYAELSGESFEILRDLLSVRADSPEPARDVVLPCELIIRESESVLPYPALPGKIYSAQCVYGENPENTITAALLDALANSGERGFLAFFKDVFQEFLRSGRDIDSFLAGLKLFHADAARAEPEKLFRVEARMYGMIAQMQEREHAYSRYQREKWHTALNSLKCELLGTRDRESLIQSLARHLPKIGIVTAALMLYEDETVTECVGNFSPEGVNTGAGRRFQAEKLLPQGMDEQYADGVFLVQPLFIENRSLGYFVHNVSFYDGVILEELRSSVSNALKGIFMFEELLRAKQAAEQAEQVKTEFFAAVGKNLYDPFIEVFDRINNLEKSVKNTNREFFASSDIGKRLEQLNAFASERYSRISHLLDLTLARLDELPLKKALFNITDFLPDMKSAGAFPLLLGDTPRLSDAFAVIRGEYGGPVSAKIQYRGLEISFGILTPAPGNPPPGRKENAVNHTLIPAEQIILMHNGEFLWKDTEGLVVLPWTTYTGEDPARNAGVEGKYALYLRAEGAGDAAPEMPFPVHDLSALPVLTDIDKAKDAAGAIAFILWNADAATEADFARVSSLCSFQAFLHTPFLCFARGLSGETLGAAVEARTRSEKKYKVLYIGMKDGTIPSWADWEAAEHISSMAEFDGALARSAPDLIVLASIDLDAVDAARRHPSAVMTPLIVLPEHIKSAEEVEKLCAYPRVALCNRSVANSAEFGRRARSIAAGDAILPLYTGALVKKVLLYFNLRAKSHILRWKIADSVNVSEDYLTRIFRREMGFSLWEYLNHYRVCLAAELLTRTGATISEIAVSAGFRDQAYFCRVFKKIYGVAPGQLRIVQKAGKVQ